MTRRSKRAWQFVLAGSVALVAMLAGEVRFASTHSANPGSGSAPPEFVGEATCATCHPREAQAWTGSHHQLAMQPAGPATVAGNFADASFTRDGVTSRFFQRGGNYVIRTDGPDGALHDYDVGYTFGVAPLQQYLVAFPDGRLQSPEIAWDSRPASAGGQRWFHLYPGEHIDHADPLHWTKVTENWNYMCADCHSTNVRKNLSSSGAYATRYAEVSVSCEACHGPGSQHVAWATASGDRRGDGLAIALDERRGVVWLRDAATGKPRRSRPRASDREIEMCARCHARRGIFHEDVVHGQPVEDDYRVALLDDDLYYPDGQIKGEVYEYGSFAQSRMFAEGVTCSDCHDPHSGKLRAPGDGVCLQCHAAGYATAQHHFHAESSRGASCVACHMPAVTYMVVDPRRDHSLRVPRPDLSEALGVPNACNGCHADRSAAWAARTVEQWYGHAPTGLQRYAEAFAAAGRGAPDAPRRLADVVADGGQPAIARATAIARLERTLAPATPIIAEVAAADASSLVRRAAVHALALAEPRVRARVVSPLLDDPVRAVRIEAAATLADVPDALLPPTSRASLARATSELVAAEELNAERPESHLALAGLHAKQQNLARAEAELAHALAIDPAFVPAAVNLADLYRVLGRDAAGETVLRTALVRVPRDPSLLHALGLALVRENRLADAIEPLGDAARLEADDPRHGYVYAIALHDVGRKLDARRELERVLHRHPSDRDSLVALVAFHREAGDLHEALTAAEQLAAVDPQDARVGSLVQELRALIK